MAGLYLVLLDRSTLQEHPGELLLFVLWEIVASYYAGICLYFVCGRQFERALKAK